jgi:hypothetical protein
VSGLEQALLQGCQWLQSTQVATSISESAYLYPAIEGTHVLALALSVGTVMWFDLRLAGLAWKKSPVSQVFLQLRPIMLVGFGLMFATGALLFSARATEAFGSYYFRTKMALLLLGGLNILLFHSTIDRRRAEWDVSQPPPLQARIAGMVSLVLWFAIIAAGRIMAYNL